jgi:hypothetical protein
LDEVLVVDNDDHEECRDEPELVNDDREISFSNHFP